jgi:hypothetical protein
MEHCRSWIRTAAALTMMRCGRTALAVLWLAGAGWAEVNRIVIIKYDGLPGYLVEDYAGRKDARTGRWELPWIKRVFFEGGSQVANFFTRGITVSAPSWSVIETGRNPIIRGNVEFDRYSFRAYDYHNFFPFYVRYARSRQVDTTGVEVLDDAGAPLLFDSFPEHERYQGLHTFQRGVRWATFGNTLKRGVIPHSIGNLVDEWTGGVEMRYTVEQQVEQELIRNLKDPRIRYLDTGVLTEFDHAAHQTHDPRVLLRVLRNLDAQVGRIWMAIESSPLADETVLVLVSDHGTNNDPAVFGQGWNLVDALRGAAGGAHHVVTNRHPREDYKIRGLNPFVAEVTNESADSFYLKGSADNYPTAMVDLDGNERGSLYLRNSDWNALQILLQQLQRRDLSAGVRQAVLRAVYELVERKREAWQAIGGEPVSELDRLQPVVEQMQDEARPLESKGLGKLDKNTRRRLARLQRTGDQLRGYREYLRSVAALLQLRDQGGPAQEQLIPRRVMGEPNSIHQLQNYVVGLAPGGLALAEDGSLDWQRSFRRVNYFAFFTDMEVRNVPQAAVSARPVDFVAASAPRGALMRSLPPELTPDSDGVWLYKDGQSQALLLRRGDQLRYLPVRELEETAQGDLHFSIAAWRDGLPLSLFAGQRVEHARPLRLFETLGKEWLEEWHSEREWLRATYGSAYSNAVVSLAVQLSPPAAAPETGELSEVERLFREFGRRERRSVQADLLILANNHWNFNVRGFNPGGNHGSFFPVSTHATLLFAGGKKTGIPRGLRISEPYDTLSFAPTVLKLAGKPEYARLPGPVIQELFTDIAAGTQSR